jgi:hypothetical protein
MAPLKALSPIRRFIGERNQHEEDRVGWGGNHLCSGGFRVAGSR